MKKTIIFLSILLFSVIICAQDAITEENYRRVDSLIWEDYQKQVEPIMTSLQAYPEKKDSLYAEYQRIYEEAQRRNLETAIKYASVPSGLQRIFMLRLDMPKEKIAEIVYSLPEDMRNSPYGKSIQKHIDTDQIKEGDKLYKFECTTINGNPLEWNTINGKQVLLLYGGLGCMGADGRQYLEELYKETSRDDFVIIVYWPSSSLEELRNIHEAFPSDYITVSDFLQDQSMFKIVYGAQATPTCFLIDNEGKIVVKSVGLNPDRFDKIIVRNI